MEKDLNLLPNDFLKEHFFCLNVFENLSSVTLLIQGKS